MMDNNFVCNLCGSTKGRKIPFRYSFNNRYLWGVKCDSCNLVSIWPRPTDKEIEEMYAEDYFTEADNQTHHMDNDYVGILSNADYSDGVAEMKRRVKPGGAILDVGCATGNFLYELKQNGFKVAGTELSAYAANYGNERFEVNIVNAPFDEALIGAHFSENSFDLIMMSDVLEHFTHPKQALQVAYKLLKPGGQLLIQLPGTLNLLSSKLAFVVFRLLNTQKTMTIPPYHLTEFSNDTSRKMLEVTGFVGISIKNEIKPPTTITLRGNFVENTVKFTLQYVNYALTKVFGIEGDRLIIEASKPK
jgi:2-polyprenyl-3-methyl-5-hydroxy-6-metoxy-1,4-benzoquinol methylase